MLVILVTVCASRDGEPSAKSDILATSIADMHSDAVEFLDIVFPEECEWVDREVLSLRELDRECLERLARNARTTNEILASVGGG